MTPLADFFAVIPAGGAGKRLWPLSRRDRPKFLLDPAGQGRTLIQQTWDRLEPLAGASRIEIVSGAAHSAAIAAQLPESLDENRLIEPAPKDSMAAIALAAAITERRHGDVVLGSFAADHVIAGQAGFAQAVEAAYLAALEGFIATIGIKPASPSTAYGYIQSGPSLGLVEAPAIRRVAAFKEKPDQATARRYLASGDYRWNAGMFVFKARVMLDQLRRLRPALADGIGQIAAAWDSSRRDEVAAALWPELEAIAFDHAIAEPVAAAGGLATAPGDFSWSDVGDFGSLAESLTPSADGGRAVQVDGSPVPLVEDSPGALTIAAGGRLVALLGLPGVVVVDTPDALLVASPDRLQDVKGLVERLEKAGQTERL
jgi:mannose-1-phosphate guanylyltransferase